MKLTNLTIKDLFTDDAKLTFLVGAGTSVDSPSCLPAGRPMMDAIIRYTCAESEVKRVLELEELRFEQLVEIVRDLLDKELKIIDYYGQCDKPNLQHYFLAEMIKKGHFVMTTNFDFLIEHALLYLEVPKEEIKVIITRKNFQKYNNPSELHEQGIKTIYKIHGSTKNIIKGKDTRDSLIATIQAFGSNKEGLNVFQIEPFKRPLFDNISKNRSLLIMGYSGSDDFDVVPTLKVLRGLQNIIWINYINDDGGNEKIYEIDIDSTNNLSKVDQILIEIHRMNSAAHIYRADANTTRMIKEIFEIKPKISPENFSASPMEWLKENVKPPDEFLEYYIPYKIYFDFDMYNDAMRCLKAIVHKAEESDSKSWKAIAITSIGLIHKWQGNYSEALKLYEEALKLDDQLGNLSNKVTDLNNIGEIHRAKGNYPEALKMYQESLKIAEKLNDLERKAVALNNIAAIRFSLGNLLEALKLFEETLKIYEQLGDLMNKSIALNNIGMVYHSQWNFPEALKRYELALMIAEQLGDLSEKATRLNNIGEIYRENGHYQEALKYYIEALGIAEQLQDLSGKAIYLNNVGLVYKALGNYSEALKLYKEALKIDDHLENLSNKAADLNNIGELYFLQENYQEALKWYEKALEIDEKLGESSGKALRLFWLGTIYAKMEEKTKSLKYLEQAFTIYNDLGLTNMINAVQESIKGLKG